MCKRDAPPRDGLSQDRSRRRSTLSNYSNKRLTKTDMVVECLEATPHEAVTLPALHSYLQENIARLTATSLTWVHDIKACLLYTSPSPRDLSTSRMPSSA